MKEWVQIVWDFHGKTRFGSDSIYVQLKDQTHSALIFHVYPPKLSSLGIQTKRLTWIEHNLPEAKPIFCLKRQLC